MSEDPLTDEPQVDFESISALIPKSKEGDQGALAELVVQIQDYLNLMAARHMDKSLQQKMGPSDIVQQTLTQVVENFEQFRGGTAAEFRGWLKTIVINEMARARRVYRADKRDIAREKQLEPPVSTAMAGITPADTNRTPSSEAMAVEQIEHFHQILDSLPDDYAEVIRLRSIQQLSFRQIAEQMGKTHDSVTKLWYRAVLKFEEKLNEGQPES